MGQPVVIMIVEKRVMLWHYHCPECGHQVEVQWEWLKETVNCPHCQASHYPATPGEDHSAYVDEEVWPQDIQEAVIALHGTTCAVPGCYSEYSKLVHRKSLSNGGRTSVDNLRPICARHAEMKGDQDYDEWVANLPPDETSEEEPFEITITTRSEPSPEEGMSFLPPGHAHPLAGKAGIPALPRGMRLIVAAPFLAGAPRYVTFHYACRLGITDNCQLRLLAWPATEPNEFERALQAPAPPPAFSEHDGDSGTNGTGKLELPLPPAAEGMWIAAAILVEEKGKPAIESYLLAETT